MDMDIAATPDETPASPNPSALAKAAVASLAEDITHETLLAVDPTAVHLGGRTKAHDHKIFGGSYWVETKSGWYQNKGKSKNLLNVTRLFYSSVNWISSDSPALYPLAAVAIVPLRAEEILVTKERGRVTFEYEVDHLFLIPARELRARSTVHANGRSSVERDWARPYRIDVSSPLTLDSLRSVVAAGRFTGVAAA